MLALNIGEILRESGEILGKYRILDERSMGSIGLMYPYEVHIGPGISRTTRLIL